MVTKKTDNVMVSEHCIGVRVEAEKDKWVWRIYDLLLECILDGDTDESQYWTLDTREDCLVVMEEFERVYEPARKQQVIRREQCKPPSSS